MKNSYGQRGLRSIAQARADREAGRFRSTATAGVVAGLALLGAFALNAVLGARSMNQEKSALLARQRAVEATVGADWVAVRACIEQEVTRLAAPEYPGDFVDPEAAGWNFASEPGLYIRIDDVTRATRPLAELAAESKIDALATCLVNGRATAHRLRDGGTGPQEPIWNVGDLYSRLYMLSDSWVEKVNQASGDFELRSLKYQFDEQSHNELSRAVEILKRTGFLLVAVDEAGPHSDAGADEPRGVRPLTRVALFDLRTQRERLRVRARGEAVVYAVGENTAQAAEARVAAQRQADNCALAGIVSSRIHSRDDSH